ncbi:MAG: hypothetical protein ACKOYC_02030 [Bacteroidota bacterium]
MKFRLVSMSDVERIWIRQYRPISEYGGWGIRYGSSGFAVNLKGSYGIQIAFKSGKKILIGTSQPARMNEALTKAGFTLSP